MNKISIRIIQSSSIGNCIVLYDQKSHLFLDFGCKPNYINNYLNKYGVSTDDISGCLITHEHIDHIQAISNDTSPLVPFYVRESIVKDLRKLNTKHLNIITLDKKGWIKIKNSNWKFKYFNTIHNSLDPISFIIKNKHKSIVYLTDTKYFYNKKLNNKNAYIIESNYGSEFITSKQKNIKHSLTSNNHLNLEETEKLLNKYTTRKTQLFLFSHLSITNKNNDLIQKVVARYSNKRMMVDFIDPHKILKYEYFL